ncbi:MAG: threonine synthase [Pseudomonadota bacterium]
MTYISTRGNAEPVDFLTACLAGLAPDGGLYVPEAYPSLSGPHRGPAPYTARARDILGAFAGSAIPNDAMADICSRAYAAFAHPQVAPLVEVAPGRFMMELYHGPSLAFKDVAMQFIAQLFDWALAADDQRMTILCATSGDTGGAAASAFAGARQIDLVILHPKGRVSPVQRLFMTTTGADNIHNLAVAGDFDDCQSIVKALFGDQEFAEAVGLSGVNSINWARIAAQSVYYGAAQAALGAQTPIRFIVPSGNMGDALAGYVAARLGLLSGFELICAVNENDALCSIFEAGQMSRTPAKPTPSPAMDITIPSNFERFLFEAARRDGQRVAAVYREFAEFGGVDLPNDIAGPLGCMGVSAHSVDNGATLQEIASVFDETGILVCPHTAVGSHVARHAGAHEGVDVVLATAHAAKFPDTVEQATGQRPKVPERCERALSGAEVFQEAPNDLVWVREEIKARVAR